MKYELIKSLSNKTVIMVVFLLLCINGLEMYFQCKFFSQEILVEDNYSTEDYKAIIADAVEDIHNNRDVFLSKAVISEFIDREITNEAYDSREAEFIAYNKFGIYGIFIVALIVIFTIDTERKSGMVQIISVISKRSSKVLIAKQLSLALCCIIINFLFLTEGIILYSLSGGLDIGMKLYNVPGYFATWYSGNILSYKIICTLGICMLQIIIGNLIYIASCFFKNTVPIIGCSLASVGILFLIGKIIPSGNCYFNIFSFLNCECLSRDFIILKFGNIYTYRLWAVVITTAACMLLVNIANFLLHQSRRSL
ncbi:MAG: hypothetical protein ACI4EN_03095 [Butyrivibrio sp.]